MRFQPEVSSSLCYHVTKMLERIVEECGEQNDLVFELKIINFHAFPVYFSSVAAIEAFINEVYLSDESRQIIPASSLWEFDRKKVDFWSLNKKLVSVPKMLFDKTFDEKAQLFQDMDTLIKVRNYLIHHKNRNEIPSFVEPLIKRSIIPGDISEFGRLSTVIKLSSATGVLWAYNTMCKTVLELLSFSSKEYQEEKFFEWFSPFPDDYIQRKFSEHK